MKPIYNQYVQAKYEWKKTGSLDLYRRARGLFRKMHRSGLAYCLGMDGEMLNYKLVIDGRDFFTHAPISWITYK